MEATMEDETEKKHFLFFITPSPTIQTDALRSKDKQIYLKFSLDGFFVGNVDAVEEFANILVLDQDALLNGRGRLGHLRKSTIFRM